MLFIFDMGGVVTNTFKMDSIYKKLNISESQFNMVCNNFESNIWQTLTTGKITTEEFWIEFNRRIGLIQRCLLDGFVKIGNEIKISTDLEIKEFENVLQSDLDLFRLYFHPVENPETVKLINLLKTKHRVVCGTNTIQSHWENHMERGDYSYFHQTYASNKIGIAKPNPDFFKVIMDAEDYSPEETFFTDDKKENCAAAESLGINTVQFTTAQDLFEKWSKLV